MAVDRLSGSFDSPLVPFDKLRVPRARSGREVVMKSYGPAKARALTRTRSQYEKFFATASIPLVEQGVVCQEGQACDVSARWFCQDGRIPNRKLAKFVIDSFL